MKKNNKGFTLAELLIVVAIIAVLVAIAIPIFTTQLEKSREATDIANVRSAYAQMVANYITNADQGYSMSVTPKQTQPDWQGESGVLMTQIDGVETPLPFSAKIPASGSYIVTVSTNDSGSTVVTIN